MRHSRFKRLAAAIAVATLSLSAHATSLSYGLSSVDADTWRYSFTITNDTLGVPIEEFTVFFDHARYTNLQLVSAPADWDPLVAQPDLALPQDGFFDWLALAAGVGPGGSLGLFEVQVDLVGPGAPGAPTFTVVDPVSFDTLDSGRAVADRQPVPVPSVLTLAATALLLAGLGSRGRRPLPPERRA